MIKIERYLSIIKPITNDSPIKIVTTYEGIQRIENTQKEKLRTRNLPESWAEIGIVYEDQYLLILRDAVIFPDGSEGTFIRSISRSGEAHGVVILPIYQNKIVIFNHFRHATRSWHLEIPRGFGEKGLSDEENARQELAEEVEGKADEIVYLGDMYTNTGISSERVLLYMAKLSSIGGPEKVEAIKDIRFVNPEEMELMIKDGLINDSFTVISFFLAKSKDLL